jgi:excisionase family DNA binding protein
MRIETFQAIQREISRDPLTERQRAEIAGENKNRLLNTNEAAEMLGISPETLRRKANRHLFPKVKTNGRSVLFRLADIVDFRNKNTI